MQNLDRSRRFDDGFAQCHEFLFQHLGHNRALIFCLYNQIIYNSNTKKDASMRKIFLIASLSLPLFAGFFPETVRSHIISSDGTMFKLAKPLPVTGMSGIVVHRFGNQVEAITGYITQTSPDGTGRLIEKEIIYHDELPAVKTPIAKGDKVIGGYLYDTLLLLAPDSTTYSHIVDKYRQKRWVHPDLFATFLSTEGEGYPTRENLARFAKAYQVGLVYIVKRNSAVLLDPISGQIVGEKEFLHAPEKAQYPFFMRFENFKTGLFTDSGDGNYYQTMEQL